MGGRIKYRYHIIIICICCILYFMVGLNVRAKEKSGSKTNLADEIKADSMFHLEYEEDTNISIRNHCEERDITLDAFITQDTNKLTIEIVEWIPIDDIISGQAELVINYAYFQPIVSSINDKKNIGILTKLGEISYFSDKENPYVRFSNHKESIGIGTDGFTIPSKVYEFIPDTINNIDVYHKSVELVNNTIKGVFILTSNKEYSKYYNNNTKNQKSDVIEESIPLDSIPLDSVPLDSVLLDNFNLKKEWYQKLSSNNQDIALQIVSNYRFSLGITILDNGMFALDSGENYVFTIEGTMPFEVNKTIHSNPIGIKK